MTFTYAAASSKSFKPFNRCAPFKALRRFKVQGSRVQRGIEGGSSGSRLSHHVVQRGVGRIGTSQRRKKSAGGKAKKEMQYTVPENPPPGDLAWF
jgi:hypothetical protein